MRAWRRGRGANEPGDLRFAAVQRLHARHRGGQGPDRITRNVYDAGDQLLKVQKAYGTPLQQDYATYSYSLNGKQLTVVDANGNKAQYTYDGFDRLAQWNFPDKVTVGAVSATDYEAYGYDTDGNRTSLRKRDARTIAYTYDNLNRVTVKTVSGTCVSGYACTTAPSGAIRNVYYDYDLRGLQIYARYDSTSGTGLTNVYDGFGRLSSSISDMDGTARTLGYQYDADGNRTRVTHPDGNYFVYLYDGLNRPSAIQHNGTTQIASFVYASFVYNAQGGRGADARYAVGSSYGYDPVERLATLGHTFTSVTGNVGWTFGRNPASQITSQGRSNDLYAFNAYSSASTSYAVNGLNQYGGTSTTTSGGTAGATLAYDSNGNLTSDGTTGYVYDVENRLVSASNGVTLDYDPAGRLWRMTSTSATVRFQYDGDALVEERDGLGNLLRRYVHGTEEDDPLVWYEGSGLTDPRSFQVDHQGSIVSIGNADGTLRTIDSYDEYGLPGTSNDGRFQYTGQAWLPALGLYYYKARMYSPKLGRFLQTDPIGYKDQVDLYAYVGNDPMDGRDPTGMAIESTHSGFSTDSISRDEGTARQTRPGRQRDGSYIAPTGRGTEIGSLSTHPLTKVIGDGQCVTACEHFSGIPGPTKRWKAGRPVAGNNSIPIGTAIATFGGKDGGFNTTNLNQNSGIYMGPAPNGGILIVDQWPAHPRQGLPAHPPKVRPLPFHADDLKSGHLVNSASAYRVIIIP